MYLFGYGSLMNAQSLRKTVPEAEVCGPHTLTGYRRVFDLKSSRRINEETGIHSCVLNIKPDNNCALVGTLIYLPTDDLLELFRRESRYSMHDVTLQGGQPAKTFIARDYEPYHYIFNDPVQEAYLRLCVEAATQCHFLDNFLDTTFIEGKTVRDHGLVT